MASIFYKAVLGLVLVSLTACAPTTNTPASNTTTGLPSRPPSLPSAPSATAPVSPFRTSVQVENSQFEKSAKFNGIEEHYSSTTYHIRSWVNKTSVQVQHQLYVADYYQGSWIFWVRASSQDAQPLEFTPINREVVFCSSYAGCSYTEHFGAKIPDSVLKSHLEGFSVKFYAKTGRELIVTLTTQQIQQQLKAVQDFQASIPPSEQPKASGQQRRTALDIQMCQYLGDISAQTVRACNSGIPKLKTLQALHSEEHLELGEIVHHIYASPQLTPRSAKEEAESTCLAKLKTVNVP